MATFKDNADREWTIKLDAPTIKAVREEFEGLDLADLTGKVFEGLSADPIALVDTLYFLCREQAKAAGVTDEQFGESLIGDAIDRATEALLEAIVNFFPKASRELLSTTVAANAAMRAEGIKEAINRISDPTLRKRAMEALAGVLDATITEALTRSAKIPSSDATNTPGPSNSDPTA